MRLTVNLLFVVVWSVASNLSHITQPQLAFSFLAFVLIPILFQLLSSICRMDSEKTGFEDSRLARFASMANLVYGGLCTGMLLRVLISLPYDWDNGWKFFCLNVLPTMLVWTYMMGTAWVDAEQALFNVNVRLGRNATKPHFIVYPFFKWPVWGLGMLLWSVYCILWWCFNPRHRAEAWAMFKGSSPPM